MQKRVVLPQLELNTENVTVLEWLVEIGDHVTAGQNLLRVETQKAVVEVPSSDDGYVREKCVETGQTINENALLSILTDSPDEPITEVSTSGPGATVTGSKDSTSELRASAPAAETQPSSVPLAVPAARKLAKELGLDLATIKASGPKGRITVEDVQGAAKGKSPTSDSGSSANGWIELSPSRIALISQMQKSLAEIPQFHLLREVEVSPLHKKEGQITFTHRLVLALAAALARHPALRTSIQGNRTKVEPVSVAIAMDTGAGLVAPVIRDADKLSLQKISATCLELKARAMAGTLRREELINAPFAVSNLGMLGVDCFSPFVFHGQTAVLGVGRARDAANDRKVAWFSLASDHRIVDGAKGARFLETLQQVISKL